MTRALPRVRPPFGSRRLADAAGLAGTLVLALLYARTHACELARRLTDRTWNQRLFESVVQGRCDGDEKCGVTQYNTFVVVVAVVVAAELAFAAALAISARWPRTRVVGLALDGITAAVAVVAACRVSAATGYLAVIAALSTVLCIAPYCGRGGRTLPPAGDRMRAAIVLFSEGGAVAWGAWLAGRDHAGWSMLGPPVVLLCAVAMRVGAAQVRALESDAVAGLPLLLLPFVGLAREPSAAWFFVPLALAAALRVMFRLREPRLPEWVVSTAAPTSAAAIALLPLRFRELPSASHHFHEGQHLAWLTSALHGKLLFADAGFIYGPGREYLLGLLAWSMGGIHLDTVRLAHVVLNLAGVAILCFLGWRLLRGHPWLFGFWWWLILARTPAWYFLNYPDEICFGWADDARAAVALLAMVLAVEACERLPERPTSRSLLPLASCGILAAYSFFYSQDCGVAGVAATALCLFADALLRRPAVPFRLRVARAGWTVGAFVGGAALLVALFVAVYVSLGRGRALIELAHYEWVVGSGVSGGSVAPLSRDDALHPSDLGGINGNANYYLPIFAVLVGAVASVGAALRGAWTSRTSLVAALTLFSCATFRYGLLRADRYHILAAAIPAHLLIVVLVCDAMRFAPVAATHRRWRVASVLVPAVIALVVWSMDRTDGLNPRLKRIGIGEERPSTGVPYYYPDLPRAGDAFVPDETLKVARYIRENTTPTDPIWVVAGYITGGEIYFLADRVDATPFDVWAEVTTKKDVERIVEALKKTPPVLVVGSSYEYTPELKAYVEAHWKPATRIGSIAIRRFDPKS